MKDKDRFCQFYEFDYQQNNSADQVLSYSFPFTTINFEINKQTYLLNASLSITIFSCLSILSIRISRLVVFLTTSSSSVDSLNFLMATIIHLNFKTESNQTLTVLSIVLILCFVNYTVGSFTYDSYYFVFIH